MTIASGFYPAANELAESDADTLKISSFTGEYRWLSNFASCTIVGKFHTYPTVEHAYQASKARHDADRAAIASAKTPGAAKAAGRKIALRPEWADPQYRVRVMRRLIELKFRHLNTFGTLLCSTGDAEIVEGNYWGDRFWGVCNGEGENHLGRLLMERRATLQNLHRRS